MVKAIRATETLADYIRQQWREQRNDEARTLVALQAQRIRHMRERNYSDAFIENLIDRQERMTCE